jgi:Myb/SANT-like DNA-binding protein
MTTPNNTTNTTNTTSISTTIINTTTITTTTTSNSAHAIWNEQQIRLLINQRRYRNDEYYQIVGRSRVPFWDSVARRINRSAGSNFTGEQCRRKFDNLVALYYVSKII